MSVQPILSNLGVGLIKQARVVLNDAQIIALPTNGILVAPSPGLDKLIIFLGATGILNNTAGAYTNFNVNAYFSFLVGGDQSVPFVENDQLAFSDDTGGIKILYWTPFQRVSASGVTATWISDTSHANTGITFKATNSDGDLEDGNAANSLVINVIYMIFNLQTGLFES